MYDAKHDEPNPRWCREMRKEWSWVQSKVKRSDVWIGGDKGGYVGFKRRAGSYEFDNTLFTSRDDLIEYCLEKVVENVNPGDDVFTEDELTRWYRIAGNCVEKSDCSWYEYRNVFLDSGFNPPQLCVVMRIWKEVIEEKLGNKGGRYFTRK